MEDLLKLYCNYHPEFLENINPLTEKIRQKVVKNLKNAKDKTNFRSTLAEIQFGLLFNELGFQLEYERIFFNKQTPDWTLSFHNSTAICDVYRIGKSKKDQIRSDFENHLIERIKELPFSYFIRVTFFEEYFDDNAYNVDIIVDEFNVWLKATNKVIGDKIIIQNNFIFEIRKINTNTNHICYYGNASSIHYKPDKLIQFEHLKGLNEITKKLLKYNKIISETKSPYFIAVSIDFVSGFVFSDFEEYFLGKGVEFIDYDTPNAKLPQFNHLGKEWSELGIFYDNPKLSGLIILDNNKFKLLLNPIKNQVIYENKNRLLLEELKKINEI